MSVLVRIEAKPKPEQRDELRTALPAGRSDIAAATGCERVRLDADADEGALATLPGPRRLPLASSDRGVLILRNLVKEAIKDVHQGRDPIGVIRDVGLNEYIEFKVQKEEIATLT